jgi:hypothetical protein
LTAKAVETKPLRPHLQTLRNGRDEMNLVEFPFSTLSERSGNQNILEFQVDNYDRILGRPVVRRLTVTGDPKYGLPTAKDEEVYLALLLLTKQHNDFGDPRVYFTRCQLIKLMGWKNRDWSYKRIGTSFCRLTGVRLFYENAWRDNAKRRYCTQGGFGLLDNFALRDGRIRTPDGDETDRLSEFRWSSVLFDSFQAGYLKRLDYEKVRSLSVIARRIYRYLDKHFHLPHRRTLTLNLKTFAFERIGMSRKNDASQIKRSLSKPLVELEEIGFLVPAKQRYAKLKGQRGEWEVTFTLAVAPEKPRRQGKKPLKAQPTRNASRSAPDQIDRYLEKLPADKRNEIESKALASASGFLLETLEAEEEGPLAEECRNLIVKAFLSERIGKRDS